jgi:hypothetical protein
VQRTVKAIPTAVACRWGPSRWRSHPFPRTTDGRPLPVDPQPSFNGYSTGKWEGDTLVVSTNGLRDDTWLDTAGTPLSGAARLTERFRRSSFDTLEIDIAVDDPKGYTRS